MGLFLFKAPKLGIDLGTSHTVVYVEGKGIVVREPSLVARDIRTGKIISVGSEAHQLIGKNDGNYVLSQPFKQGVVVDFETTVEMMKYFIKKAIRFTLKKPLIMFSIPSGLTKLEQRAMADAAQLAGASQILLVEVPLAAAIGAGLPVHSPVGTLIVDIGGGMTEMATISYGRMIDSRSIKVGGNTIVEAILNFVKKKYALTISEQTAENIIMTMSSVNPQSAHLPRKLEVKGRNIATKTIKSYLIEEEEFVAVIFNVLQTIIQTMKQIIEEAAPEVAADLISEGIVLTGGGALLPQLDVLLSQELMIPVRIAEDPLHCVIRGVGEIIKDRKIWQNKNRNGNEG